jgi:hypothetical protein
MPSIPLEKAWQTLVADLKPCHIRRLELTLRDGPILGRRFWVDPGAQDGRICHWSVAVSLQQHDDWRCELRADGLEKPKEEPQVQYLTGLLKQFADQLGARMDNIPVLPFMKEIQIVPDASDRRRKAA